MNLLVTYLAVMTLLRLFPCKNHTMVPIPMTTTALNQAFESMWTSTTTTTDDDAFTNPLQIIPGVWSDENLQRTREHWSLTPKEFQQLKDLQKRLSDVHYHKNNPEQICWFLRGPLGFSTKSIEHYFRRMVQWRLDHDIDNILTNYQPSKLMLDNSVTTILQGLDRDNDPIYVERGPAMDAYSVLKQSSKEEMIHYAIWNRELHSRGPWKRAYERQQGHPLKGITIVYDMQGLCSRHLHPRVMDVFQQILQITKDYYSAPVKRIIIIRAPAIFRLGWSIVKHLFPASARKKMIFARSDNYLEILDHYMDLDVLPSCINPNGHGRSMPGLPKLIGAEDDRGSIVDMTPPNFHTLKPKLLIGKYESPTIGTDEASSFSSDSLTSGGVTVSTKKLLAGHWNDTETTSTSSVIDA